MWFNLILVIILTICVITDIKERKIYNKVLFPCLILTLISHILLGGWSNLYTSFIGFFTGLFILIIPYFLGGIGAGDVKLLALIGAIKGPSFVFYTAIYMGIAGGMIAFILLLYQKRLYTTLKSLLYYIYSLKHGVKMHLSSNNDTLTNAYPYGIAIAIGAVFTLFLEGRIIL
ncbi:prepilin peptidase [Lutibacter sp. B2]|nr:prepilin peptidase [Lutibacter sp. B2]